VPERRVALVIGNSAYTAVPPLANPQRDAKGISAALKRLGFDVVEGYDLKMDEMTGIVREFAQKLDGAKAGLVYYAGHGIAVGDENYLIPVDASLRSKPISISARSTSSSCCARCSATSASTSSSSTPAATTPSPPSSPRSRVPSPVV
jgi:uncharacterized caspase-like protein